MAQLLRMMGLLFSEINHHILCFLDVQVQVIVTIPDSYVHMDLRPARVLPSTNMWSLMDGSLEVQMLLYRKKRRRGARIPGVCQC